MGLFGKKQESYIGVDIGAHGIKLVELRKTKNRPQLWTYGLAEEKLDIHPAGLDKPIEELLREPVPGGTTKVAVKDNEFDDAKIDRYAAILKELVKASRVSGRMAASSLPVSHVFHTIINLPKVPDKEIDTLVSAEVAKILSQPIDEVQIVHQQVPLDEKLSKQYIRLLVTAAPKQMVRFYSGIFQKAGLQLQELETEAFALARSLVGKDETLTMTVDIGAERTNFALIDKGLPMTQRSLHLGGQILDRIIAERLGVTAQQAMHLKHDLATVSDTMITFDPFIRFLEPIAKEIQYHFDLYLSQSGNEGRKPEKIILTGGSALFPPIAAYLKQQFLMRVFIGDPWARVIYQEGMKPLLNDIAPRMAVSIGLALRHF